MKLYCLPNLSLPLVPLPLDLINHFLHDDILSQIEKDIQQLHPCLLAPYSIHRSLDLPPEGYSLEESQLLPASQDPYCAPHLRTHPRHTMTVLTVLNLTQTCMEMNLIFGLSVRVF